MNENYTELSFKNKSILLRQQKCGCYHCLNIFETKAITEWLTEADNKKTALCPHCGIDSVIPFQQKEFKKILENLQITQF